MKWAKALVAFAFGATALTFLWMERYAYGDFLPLHGYQELNVHVITPQEGLFFGLFTVLGTIATAGLAVAACLANKASLTAWLGRLLRVIPDAIWLAGLGTLAAVGSAVVGWGVLRDTFLTDDEMAMLFQAQVLLDGRLWAEPAPFVDVFHYAMVIEDTRWYGMYPLGHSLFMALSLLVTGSARAIFVLVAAAWVLLTFWLARRFYGRSTAILASALLCLSPFFVFTSGSLAAELTSGLFLLIVANVAVRIDQERPATAAIVLGLALGAAFFVRPYTTLAVGAPLGLWVVWLWFRRSISFGTLGLVVLCALPFAAAYLAVNAAQTGSPWLTPYEVNFANRFRLGFGQDAFGIIHTPQLALASTGLAVLQLNGWALGWPLSLLPVACALCLERLSARAIAVMVTPLCLLLAYVPVPVASVHDTGPIYYLETLPVLLILAARGLVLVSRAVARRWDERGRDLVAWVAVTATLVGGLVFWRQQLDVLDSLADFNNAPYDVAERTIEGRALIFVDEIQTEPPSSWVLGIRPPNPDFSERLVFGHVVTLARAQRVLRWAEGRRGYFLSRDQRTGDVSLVPLPAPAAEARGRSSP